MNENEAEIKKEIEKLKKDLSDYLRVAPHYWLIKKGTRKAISANKRIRCKWKARAIQ